MSLIVSDFECPECGEIEELIFDPEEHRVNFCPKCGAVSNRIISLGRVYLGNQDAVWLKSVVDVVDKSNPASHVQEFVKNPTRANYKAWMRGEGIRPADSTVGGAPPRYEKPTVNTDAIRREVWQRYQDRNRLEVR